MDVPGNTHNLSAEGTGTGRQRSERLRARRNEAGLAQVSGWVPKERRAYAREVLAALVRGTNSLPPDPEQAAALDAVRAEAEAAKAEEFAAHAALAEAEERRQVLAAERDTANTRASAAEQERDEARHVLQAAEAAAEQARAEIKRFQEAPGLRGRVIRWLAR